jgi:hypothetical protein
MTWLKKLLEMILAWFGVKEIPPPASQDPRPNGEAGDESGNGRVTVDPDREEEPGGTVEDTLMDDEVEEDAMPGRPELKKGDKGDMVEELQRLLNKNGAGIGVDGDFGGRTERAVMSFDQSYGLEEDGIADATTWEILDRPPFWKDDVLAAMQIKPGTPLDDAPAGIKNAWNSYGGLLQEIASRLGFDPSAAIAVLCAESSGKGFNDDGSMKIRFENHVFYSRWGKHHPDTFAKHFKFDADQRWKGHYWRSSTDLPWERLHVKSTGQKGEWAALGFARTLDDEAALDSISMGAPQVMGFNSARIGYETAREMFDNWQQGDREQIVGLFSFIRSNHKMVRALRDKDWEAFAYRYNGSGQAAHYGEIIENYAAQAQAAGIA